MAHLKAPSGTAIETNRADREFLINVFRRREAARPPGGVGGHYGVIPADMTMVRV